MQLTSELFDEMAKKVGVTFSKEEKVQLMVELNGMIRFVDKIRDVDTKGVERLEAIPMVEVLEKEKTN